MTSLNNGSLELNKLLAEYLLALNPGEQILSTRKLATRYAFSIGSVSSSLNYLEKIGAVAINRRGHLGSFLEEKSLGTLWRIIEECPMVIALTLPSFRKCEGLATAIHSILSNAGIETYMTFIRGSTKRLQALKHSQCHAAVMSLLAAEELGTEDEEILMCLPPQSYVLEHAVFFREDSTSPLKIGYDPESFDVKYLTELEFKDQDVLLQPMTFTQIDLHLEDSPVDAAITNVDFNERLKNKGFLQHPLSPNVKAIVGNRHTSAAIVTRKESVSAKYVLKQLLDPKEILRIQRQVVEGGVVPRY